MNDKPQQNPTTGNAEELYAPMEKKGEMKYFLIRAFVKAIGKFIAIVPERVAYGLCVGLASFAYHCLPKYRLLARRQLDVAFRDEKSEREITAILKQAYANQGRNLAEFLMIPHKSAEWINKKMTLDDPDDVLRHELDKGKGVVAIGAHVGNIEMVCAWLGVNNVPMVTIVKAQRDALFTKLVMNTRLKWGSELIFKTRGVKKECFHQLEKNKIIGLVADQNAASGGVFVDYFGKKASTVAGPAVIAMKTGLPIVPAFMSSRNPDNTHVIHVLPPILMRDTGDREADVAYNVQQYTKAIEDFVRRYPSEYLWWHRRWKTRPPE